MDRADDAVRLIARWWRGLLAGGAGAEEPLEKIAKRSKTCWLFWRTKPCTAPENQQPPRKAHRPCIAVSALKENGAVAPWDCIRGDLKRQQRRGFVPCFKTVGAFLRGQNREAPHGRGWNTPGEIDD